MTGGAFISTISIPSLSQSRLRGPSLSRRTEERIWPASKIEHMVAGPMTSDYNACILWCKTSAAFLSGG